MLAPRRPGPVLGLWDPLDWGAPSPLPGATAWGGWTQWQEMWPGRPGPPSPRSGPSLRLLGRQEGPRCGGAEGREEAGWGRQGAWARGPDRPLHRCPDLWADSCSVQWVVATACPGVSRGYQPPSLVVPSAHLQQEPRGREGPGTPVSWGEMCPTETPHFLWKLSCSGRATEGLQRLGTKLRSLVRGRGELKCSEWAWGSPPGGWVGQGRLGRGPYVSSLGSHTGVRETQ